MLCGRRVGADRRGEGVLCVERSCGSDRVTEAAGTSEKPVSASVSFYLSVRGESRNRIGLVDFFKINYSAITTQPPEANSLMTNERK